jgi:hypothetical protein
MNNQSQKEQVLEHLKIHNYITPLTALNEYGCFRLAAIIHDLRKTVDIKTTRGGNKNYAIYSLKENQQ